MVVGGDDNLVDDLLQVGVTFALEIFLSEYKWILVAGFGNVFNQVFDDCNTLGRPCKSTQIMKEAKSKLE